jgi:hypothetical protein
MRSILFCCLSILQVIRPFANVHAQVAIGHSTVDPNAILDLDNTQRRALLVPRLDYSDRQMMVNPSFGLMFYMGSTADQVNEPIGLYVQRNGSWQMIMTNKDIQKTWAKLDNAQYSLLDNVGIGVTAPTSALHIRRSSGLNMLKLEATTPMISFSHGTEQAGFAQTARIFANASDLIIGTALGSSDKRVVFQVSGENKISIEPNGNLHTRAEIRMTDQALVEKGFVQINGSDLRIGTVGSNSTGSFVVRTNGGDHFTVDASGDVIPAGNIQFKDGTANIGFIQRSGADLRLGTNSSNDLGQVILRLAGNDRFHFEKTGRMTISSELNPTLYFNANGANQAFLQVQGNNLSISAPNDKLLLNSELTVDGNTGRIGVGTTSPEQKLHVQGSAKISTGRLLNNSDENLLPLGFAVFDGSGNKLSGTANLTGGWIVNDFYLTCAGTNINNTAISITCRNARLYPSFFNANDGKVQINLFDDSGDKFKAGFSVVVYKAN